jgi:hypothetical protein
MTEYKTQNNATEKARMETCQSPMNLAWENSEQYEKAGLKRRPSVYYH